MTIPTTSDSTVNDRKMRIVAAAHAFTLEMEALDVKFAMVAFDETLQREDGVRMYTIGNVVRELQDWLLETYLAMRGREEVVDCVHVKSQVGVSPS